MKIPTQYLSFQEEEPADKGCVEKSSVKGIWAVLHKPVSDWPKELVDEHLQDLYFLFPNEFKTENYNSRDVVCLCSSVNNCPRKARGQLEKRDCDQYRRGLCIEASVESNDCEPLALGSIARFHGLSKQRIHQIYNNARKRLILELAKDEIIQEYLIDLFIGKSEIPDPDQIEEFITKALGGG